MDTEQNEKKVRKRYKHLFKQIRAQMEFYFSDSNLQKDRFVKKLMDENEDKWIPLEVFKNFNKLKSITEDMSLVARALASSELIEVNESNDKVRRTKPIADPGDLDARTIYVEKLPAKVTHDWVKSVFSAFGTVTYVSLPRFKSTGDFKGFGFVEFQDAEEAKRAVREYTTLSSDTTKKAGVFPTGSKQMKQAIKQAVANNIPLPDSQPTSKNAKKRTRSEDEERTKGAKKLKTEEENEEEESSEEKPDSVKTQSAEEKEEDDESSEEKVKVSKKRKNKERKDDEGEEVSEDQIKSAKKRKNKERKEEEDEESSEEKTKSKKKKKMKKKEEGKEDEASAVEDKKGTKRKHEGESENVSPKKQKTEEPEKKKNRKKKKKHEKTEEAKLKVLSKAEWLELRKEYLQLQKANMKKLKESLRKAASPMDQTQTPTKGEPTETNSSENTSEQAKRGLEFVADVVIEVTSKLPLERKRLKEVLSEHGEVSYIDIVDEDSKAIVRCPTAFNAKKIISAEMSSYERRLLQGEEETQYWDKIKADREKRLNSNKKKVRGKDRAINKALQRGPVIETIPKERKKVYFRSPHKCSS